MHRREFLRHAAALPLLAVPPVGAPILAVAGEQPTRIGAAPFDSATVRRMARELAEKPYTYPEPKLPEPFNKFGYDEYRDIRFRPANSLWRDAGLRFQVQLFHRGFIYRDRVDIYEVAEGRATLVRYQPDLFDMGRHKPPAEDLGFAGFRIHTPINNEDSFDEVIAFLGASYFRAVAKHQHYGLSARALAIKTGDAAGEEFPLFKTFWIERPRPGATSIVVHALLDSPSTTGAYRFSIRPGEDTVVDVESVLFPRKEIQNIGLAPLTSMFFFDPSDRKNIDDYRSAVHDSNGLYMLNGNGEPIWRPLTNPFELQVSVFNDFNPRGFGLMQRARDFSYYNDLEARYEGRPSLWIEPIGDAGEGAVMLIEIPTKQEIHDNIVAFWRPSHPIGAGREHIFNYRQHWCWEKTGGSELAKVVATRTGGVTNSKNRLFIIELAGEQLRKQPPELKLHAEVTSSEGKIENVVAQPNPKVGGWRIAFEFSPAGSRSSDLRAQLLADGKPLSEAWIYRWTP